MTTDGVVARTLEQLGRVLDVLEARAVPAAVVGAAALALHGYARSTADVDVGVAVASLAELRALAEDLRAALAVDVDLALPDAEDPLGGVVTLTSRTSSR